LIVDTGHFTVHTSQDRNQLELSYECIDRNNAVGYLPIPMFKVVDLTYYAQMLGRDGMSSSCYTSGRKGTLDNRDYKMLSYKNPRRKLELGKRRKALWGILVGFH
jgi:hypothetical protein